MTEKAEACPGADHVTILLGLCNGARYLAAQLDSFLAQDHPDWSLIVSDDGSDDRGPDIVRTFAAAHPERRVTLIAGPRAGFQRNYLHLAKQVSDRADFVAFADQDDVWLPTRLSRGLRALSEIAAETPALYGSRTILAGPDLSRRGLSPLFGKRPSFENALVQSIMGGNTMLMNRACVRLLQKAARRTEAIVSHDWWAYLLVTGAGGRVIYDPGPSLLYRQHGENLVGANAGMPARLRRLRMLLDGGFAAYAESNVAALTAIEHDLTAENRETLRVFRTARKASLLPRIVGFWRSGVYRQTAPGSVALWTAIVLGRV